MPGRIPIAAIAALLFATGIAAASENHQHASQQAKASLVCPVMHGIISSPAKSGGKSVYKGRTYYFCCPGCKPKFDKNPLKYVCPVTGNVLPAKPPASSTYAGKTYYFCSTACKPKFDKNPRQYLQGK